MGCTATSPRTSWTRCSLEAGKFATDIIAPLNAIGDRHGTPFKDGNVATPPGWKEAYHAWAAGRLERAGGACAVGRSGFTACGQCRMHRDVELGRYGIWSWPFSHHGRHRRAPRARLDELKRGYLPKFVSGEWMGTMQLTEPQAGSDVGALRTRARRAPDGSYRITGQKIFITYGEHDLTENIIHFVLARLPDAPAGTKGISLFLVPKFLPNADGSPGRRNDVRAHSIEHKLGIHASPTCTMVYGDAAGPPVSSLARRTAAWPACSP